VPPPPKQKIQDADELAAYQVPKARIFADSYLRRVARWYVFKPKIQIWVNFCGPCNEKSWLFFMVIWNMLRQFGIVKDHLEYYGNLVL
jgi:hypothetical protein